MAEKKFDLGDYVEVKDRIRVFYELFGQGRLTTERVEILTAPDGKQRVMVHAQAFRTPDDPHPGDGYSWMELPGTTPYTRGSEVENAETSAWGRAIGSLGILIDRSIASQNEIDAKAGEDKEPHHDGELIGVAEVAKPPHDFQLREGPNGPSIGFGLKEGRQIVRVVAHGPLASALHLLQADVIGQRVTTFGVVEPDVWVINKGKDNERRVPYLRQTLERIQTPSGTLPSTSGLEAPDDAPEAQAASGGSLGGPPDAQMTAEDWEPAA